MLYVPEGFAQGYQTLVDDCEVSYQMTHEYVPEAARGVRWDDPRSASSGRRPRADHLRARSLVANHSTAGIISRAARTVVPMKTTGVRGWFVIGDRSLAARMRARRWRELLA